MKDPRAGSAALHPIFHLSLIDEPAYVCHPVISCESRGAFARNMGDVPCGLANVK